MAKKEEKVTKQYVDPKKATPEQVQEALALLNKKIDRQERIKKGEIKGYRKWSELSDDQKDKLKASSVRRNAKIKLMCQKAIKAGITVTESEIDAELAARA